MDKYFIATIKVLVKADSQAEACDLISETLRPATVDWTYLGLNYPLTPLVPELMQNPYRSPSEITLPDNYDEGDIFNMGEVAPA
jgi:hypothetical protein